MSDLIVIQPQVTELTVTEQVNQVTVASVGVQGAKGDTGTQGPKGDTGDQGPSGVIAVTAPITNSGTSTSANIGVSAGSTSTAGVLQLTDSISSTSTTTAATPNSVKTISDMFISDLNILPLRSGKYYVTFPWNSTITATANTTYYHPFFVPNSVTLDRLQFATTTTFLGTSVVRLGIYANNNGVPGNLILDAGTVSATAANTVYSITISQSVVAGTTYWLAFNSQTAATTNIYSGASANAGNGYPITGYMTASNFAGIVAYAQTSVTGAFANAGTVTDSQAGVKIGVRVV